MNNLRRLDMNQLLTLQVLLSERHVSRTAKKLNKSQPAISHALNQLRDIFNDPLLVRENGVYVLSPKAQSLYQPLSQALQDLSALLSQGDFLPATSERHFRFSMSDYGSQLILPKLMLFLQKNAPNISLEVCACSREQMQIGLLAGQFDLVFGVFERIHPELISKTLFTDSFICWADQNHPLLQEKNTTVNLDQWLDYPHVAVEIKAYDAAEVEQTLASLNLKRHIACTLPYWHVASNLLPNTDLILTMAAKTIGIKQPEHIQAFAAPLALPSIHFQMLNHARSQSDAALLWLLDWFVEEFSMDGWA